LAIGCIGEFPRQIPSNFELPKFTKFKFHANLSPKGSLIFLFKFCLEFEIVSIRKVFPHVNMSATIFYLPFFEFMKTSNWLI
jgi:hypothetical protein